MEQADTLRLFTVLSALRDRWAGCLILSCGLSRAGSSFALAANIAGAACLSIERSAETCRAALRLGAVDFVVNSLDEALRALKNEIRKGHPLSVALEGDLESVLAEVWERGVLPELFTGFINDPGGLADAGSERLAMGRVASYAGRIGSFVVDFDGTLAEVPEAIHGWERLSGFVAEHDFRIESFPFASLAELRSFDARVLEVLPPADSRRRWVSAASRHFGRSRQTQAGSLDRYVYLTAREKHLLAVAR